METSGEKTSQYELVHAKPNPDIKALRYSKMSQALYQYLPLIAEIQNILHIIPASILGHQP